MLSRTPSPAQSLPPSLCAAAIAEATRDMQRNQFDDAFVNGLKRSRRARNHLDGFLLGAPHFARGSAHDFRRGKWGTGIAKCLATPACLVGWAATGLGGFGLSESYGLNAMPQVPNLPDLRKYAAQNHLREASRLLVQDLSSAVDHVLRDGTVPDEVITALHTPICQALESFAAGRDTAEHTLRYSQGVERRYQILVQQTHNLYQVVAQAAYERLLEAVGKNADAQRALVAHGTITHASLDHIAAQWQNLRAWTETLPPETAPAKKAMQRHEHTLHRSLTDARKLLGGAGA